MVDQRAEASILFDDGRGQLLADDLVTDPLLPVNGALPVGRRDVDPGKALALAPSYARTAHWRDRLAAVRQDLGL